MDKPREKEDGERGRARGVGRYKLLDRQTYKIYVQIDKERKEMRERERGEGERQRERMGKN